MTYDSGLNQLIATFPLRLRQSQDEHDSAQQTNQLQKAQFDQNQMLMPYKIQNAQSDMETAKLDQAKKKLDMVSSLVGGVVDQGTYDQALQQARGMGLDVTQFGPVYNPQQIESVKKNAASATAQLNAAISLNNQKLKAAQGTMGAQVGDFGWNPNPTAPATSAAPSPTMAPPASNNSMLNPGFTPSAPPAEAPIGQPLTDEAASQLPPTVAAGPALTPPESANPVEVAQAQIPYPMPKPGESVNSYKARLDAFGKSKQYDPAAQGAIAGAEQDKRNQSDVNYAAKKAEETAKGTPMPSTIVQAQDDLIDSVQTHKALEKKMGFFADQIASGALDLGIMANLINKQRNNLTMSTQESRDLASFQANLEQMRNESLRLNKGVQTEGDSVRAWNEMFQNLNDPKTVMQRLLDIKNLNNAGAILKKKRLDAMRSEYKRPGMKDEEFAVPETVLPSQAGGKQQTKVLNGKTYVNYGGGPTDWHEQ